ncbi:response regulator transcription factor [Chloroflexota bacterium]
MNKESILIVDDDPKMIKLLQANLRARGYSVSIAQDGDEALELIEREFPDLIILDLLMPRLDGREVCRRLREWSDIPILVISALGQVRDKVACLELGVDDYLSKPFSIDELIARIIALLRRTKKSSYDIIKPCVKVGELEIDLARGHVSLAGNPVSLTATEYKLLQVFALNVGKVLTHEYLLQKVWGAQFQKESEYLRVYISHIRKKLASQPDGARYILTVPSTGYQLG